MQVCIQHMESVQVRENRDGGEIVIQIAPNGVIAVSGYVRNASLWSIQTGELLHTLPGHRSFVTKASFTYDSSRVLTMDGDTHAKIWDVSTGNLLHYFGIGPSIVHSIKYSSDASMFVAGCEDSRVRLWDATTGGLLKTFEGHTDRVWNVAFSPDMTKIASGSYDGEVKIWDVGSMQCLRTLKHETQHVYSLTFSPDSAKIVVGLNIYIFMWDVDGVLQWIYHGPGPFMSSSFSHDGTMVATGTDKGHIDVFHVETLGYGKLLSSSKADDKVWSIFFTADGQNIMSCTKSVRIYRTPNKLVKARARLHSAVKTDNLTKIHEILNSF